MATTSKFCIVDLVDENKNKEEKACKNTTLDSSAEKTSIYCFLATLCHNVL